MKKSILITVHLVAVIVLASVVGIAAWKYAAFLPAVFEWNADMREAFFSKDAASAFSACAVENGKMVWIEEGIFMANTTRRLECIVPYYDGGKACTDNSQCVSRHCVANVQMTPEGNPAEGTCAKDSMPDSCATTVSGGKSNAEYGFCQRV